MINVRVLNIQPHPDQATNNPDDWAVQFQVSYDGKKRTFWRWHTARELDGYGIRSSTNKKPTPREILKRYWDDAFAELHGFSFNKDDP
ncbi:MAG TPA: hypothetical protein VLE97_10060 [Gaiellaceae bacterium]|nr:hypothetical protein [Gaiellaceae bacterium]